MSTIESIDVLVEDGIVDAIVQRVKTGKEAEVYIVRKGEEYLAAKVYKERTQRNFKNNVGYMEGRLVRNSRDQRALAKRTKYGVDLAEDAWMQTEHDALFTLVAAGVRAPRPELFYEGVLLMELVLDAEGQPAPRLSEVSLTREDALAMHRDVISQVVRMLTCDLIHGDLSPFNILLAWNGPTIIDIPQVVKAAHNSQAEKFLVRDVRNVTEHFARFAPELKARVNDGYTIWRKYERRELTPDFFPPLGAVAPRREHVPAPRRESFPRSPRQGPPPQSGSRHTPQSRAAHSATADAPAVDRRPPRRDGDARPPRRDGDARPPRPQGDARPPRRDGDARPPRPQGDARPPRREGDARPPRPQGDARPPRREGDVRPPRPNGAPRPNGPSGQPRPEGGRGGRFNPRPRRDGR